MLHASNACLSFLMLRITSLLLYQTHAEHALTMRYTHVLPYIYTLVNYHVTLASVMVRARSHSFRRTIKGRLRRSLR